MEDKDKRLQEKIISEEEILNDLRNFIKDHKKAYEELAK